MWTMAENLKKIKQQLARKKDTSTSPTGSAGSKKKSKEPGLLSSMEEIISYDAIPQMQQNIKELKTLQFEASKVVSGGTDHLLIPRDQG